MKNTRSLLLCAGALLIGAAPLLVSAAPPAHAPAPGWRAKNDPAYAGYTGQRWDRDYGVLDGRKLIDDGAPFTVPPAYAKYEWTYRGWPPPGHVRRLAALEEHREATQFQPLDATSPSTRLELRIPQALVDRIDAVRDQQSRSEFVRDAIEVLLTERG